MRFSGQGVARLRIEGLTGVKFLFSGALLMLRVLSELIFIGG